jgi:arylsulfatase A-like enzyme
MQTYAAQVERMDRGVGRLVATLSALGELENTLLIFLSDNGASPEDLPLWSAAKFAAREDILPRATRKGWPIRVGNSPGITPGPEDTYASYGRTWANLSNTPFRYYKRWAHEGGIAAPFIAHWPAASLPAGAVCHSPFQLTDVVPTLLEAAGTNYPEEIGHRAVLPLEGTSMLAALRGRSVRSRQLFWEHTGNAAIRSGQWKLVRQFPGPWELYDVASAPAETVDLAKALPSLVRDLSEQWQNWAGRVGVIPWEVTLDIYRRRGFTDEEAAG